MGKRKIRAVVVALALLGLSATGRADTFGAQLHYATGSADLSGRELSTPAGIREPEVLQGKQLRLWGDGELEGATLRGEYLLDQTRLGLGFGVFSVSEASVVSGQLPVGVEVRPHTFWMLSYELFVERELTQGPVYLYFDARASFDLMQAQLEVHTDSHGHVGTTPYNLWSLGLGPRLGMLIPVGHSTMIDLAVTQRVLGGLTQTMFMLGLGFWENDRQDEFSQALKRTWRGEF